MDTLRPQIWKFIALFTAAVAGMLLPVAVCLVLIFRGPPPYLLKADRLGPEWADSTPHNFPDGTSVTVYSYADEAAARQGAGAVLKAVPRSSTEMTTGATRYTRRDNERRGLVTAVSNRVLRVEAAHDARVDARLGALPFVVENPEKGPLTILFTRYLLPVLLGLVCYLLLWFALLFRGGAWAASLPPAPGAAPVPAETLRARLLAVNDLGLPFQVAEAGPGGQLVAEWRIADARWIGLMEAGGLAKAHQIHLQLDPGARTVWAQDRDRTISWSAGVARPRWSWSFFRGISFFQYERGLAAGLFFKDGRWTTTAYNYLFHLAEMKNPLIRAIVESGWTFAPVVWMGRSPRP
jgi:hypothetical protein